MLAAVILAVSAVAAGAPVTAETPSGARVEWRRGETPILLVLPRPGEGWLDLAGRVAGGRSQAGALRAANPGVAAPLRGVRVRVPITLVRGESRAAAVIALFGADRRTPDGWAHVITAPWGGDGESWWELAEWFCGDGSRYPELREANPELGLFPSRGSRVLVPTDVLLPEFRRLPPNGPPARSQPMATPLPSLAATLAPGPVDQTYVRVETETVESSGRVAAVAVSPDPAPTRAEPAEQHQPTSSVPAEETRRNAADALEFAGDEAIYRLRVGEALYSAVVVRFTGLLDAVDVNATALELARRSGIADVRSIPVGYPVRIPFALLLPEYLPAAHPRRQAWESERKELQAIRRELRAANLKGIHVILDAGHGGADSGAVVGDVWESSYTYDVMERLKAVLERETQATVWLTVRDRLRPGPRQEDILPPSRTQRLLVDPPYDLSDPGIGVNLRWVLSNAILARLEKRKVKPERVAFVSIHADSLHPTVRGIMVYVPARSLRPARGPNPSSFLACREGKETKAPHFPPAFRSRSEALSMQLGESVVRAARKGEIAVHPYRPIRSSILRGGSRWVPAVLRYSRVPTSVLIEIGNLNNKEDREAVRSWRHREKLAHAIAVGLAEGFSR